MAYPNNWCGECPTWLAIEDHHDLQKAIDNTCQYCPLFSTQQFVRHMNTGCCYPLEADGKTVIICGAHLTPDIDGKMWAYADRYEAKEVHISDPYANHKH